MYPVMYKLKPLVAAAILFSFNWRVVALQCRAGLPYISMTQPQVPLCQLPPEPPTCLQPLWVVTGHGVELLVSQQIPTCSLLYTWHCICLEKEMATHSRTLAWRIPWTGEPGGLPSVGSHRVRHYWSDLAAAAVYMFPCTCICTYFHVYEFHAILSIRPTLSFLLCPQVCSLCLCFHCCPARSNLYFFFFSFFLSFLFFLLVGG